MSLADALDGVRVLEVAAYLPGPACAQILGDLGATVIKVERPGGDPLRTLEPRPPGGENPIFGALNRGKRTVELNLKTAEGAAALADMAEGADVLIDGFRPGVMERLGVGATVLRGRNPRLVYCALSGYGAASPWRERAGHDLNFVALSGLMALTSVGGQPAMPGTQLADLVSGLMAATAILAALQRRATTGMGATIDLAMSDVARWLMLPALAQRRAGLPLGPEQANPLGGAWACYHRYRTADGRYLAVAAIEPHFWARFCEAIEQPELIDQQYDPAAQPVLQARLAAVIGGEPLAAWVKRFAVIDACVSPVLSLDEVDELEQHRSRGFDDRTPLR